MAGPEARQIVVEDGQSISRIAARYRVPKAAIIAANRLEPPYKIKPGQRLVIPGSSGPAPVPASEARQIVVEEGRSISRIAAKYRVPESAIIEANHLTPPYKIKIGQRLLIPNGAEAPVVVASRASEPIPLDDPAPGSAPSLPSSAQPQAEASPGPTAALVSTEPAPMPIAAAPAPPPVPVAAAPAPPPVPVAAAPVLPPVPITAEPALPPVPVAAEPVPPPVPVAAEPVPPPVPVAAEPVPPPVSVAVAQAAPLAAAAAPAGATCPPGRTGTWSTDIIRQPVYICR